MLKLITIHDLHNTNKHTYQIINKTVLEETRPKHPPLIMVKQDLCEKHFFQGSLYVPQQRGGEKKLLEESFKKYANK